MVEPEYDPWRDPDDKPWWALVIEWVITLFALAWTVFMWVIFVALPILAMYALWRVSCQS